jgi:hypothetical protein
MSEDSVKLPEPKQMCADPCRTCVDHDEDCEDLQNKVACWLYAPEKGMCPYLRSKSPTSHE